MSTVDTISPGDLWSDTKWNNFRTAFLKEHLNTAGNEHAESINLGDGTSAGNRSLRAKIGAATFRDLRWNNALARWEFSNDGAAYLAMGGGVAAAAAALFFAPPYGAGVSELTSVFTTIPPKFDPKFDSTAKRNNMELDNVDSTTNTVQTNIQFIVPEAVTLSTIKIWHKRTGADGSTFLTVEMLGTDGLAVTLTGGSTLQSAAWVEATVTIGAGTLTALGTATIRLTHSAKNGEKQASGAVRVVPA